ncbi:Allantoate permease [Escovopsis weberi]|uniref:Allantoate permease n=1 Tax=Escovopsis weberi TaxID=150374 RepID=A0A0M9VV54_ESCWE|nr:Allantoate permease [Escovopsis weberi]
MVLLQRLCVLTITIGIIFLFLMPDNQLNARFLSQEERILAIHRIRINEQGIGSKHFKPYQVKEAIRDPAVWGIVLFALMSNIPNGGITNFFSQLIVSFGFTPQQSLLYGTPGGAVEVIFILGSAYLGDLYGNRALIGTSGVILSMVGIIMMMTIPLDKPGGRLVGFFFTQVSFNTIRNNDAWA